MITEGRVSVNGKVVRELGTKVDPLTDEIHVDGEPIVAPAAVKPVYIMLNKPVGYTCTVSDANAERTIMELISQVEERVYPVGRLDVDSSGLLLLTNDGEFANRLTHPRFHVPKVYRVRARGFVDREAANQLVEGIDLPDGRTAPAELMFVEYDAATQCTIVDITLFEGRNRQVRRMMEAVGNPVRDLTRVRFGSLGLKGLNPGTWRKLTETEVEELLALAKPTPTPPREERRTPQKPLPAPGGIVPLTPAPPRPAPRHKNDVARVPRRPLGDAARNSSARAKSVPRTDPDSGPPSRGARGRARPPARPSNGAVPPPAGGGGFRPPARPAYGSNPPPGASGFRPPARPSYGSNPPPFGAGRPRPQNGSGGPPPPRSGNGRPQAFKPGSGRPSTPRPPRGKPR